MPVQREMQNVQIYVHIVQPLFKLRSIPYILVPEPPSVRKSYGFSTPSRFRAFSLRSH